MGSSVKKNKQKTSTNLQVIGMVLTSKMFTSIPLREEGYLDI